MKRERGRVVAFNAAEGHGLIRSMVLGDELFIHFSYIEQTTGFRALAPGQVVEYWRALQPGPSGVRPAAHGVVVVPSTNGERDDRLIAGITEVIGKVDPMNLLADGAPSDEYDHVVSQLAPRVWHATSRAEVEVAVVGVFDEAFGLGSVPSAAISLLVEGLMPLTATNSIDAG
jgi:CspA family cold shock protein